MVKHSLKIKADSRNSTKRELMLNVDSFILVLEIYNVRNNK